MRKCKKLMTLTLGRNRYIWLEHMRIKAYLSLLCLLLVGTYAQAQYQLGMRNSNYNGIYGVVHNPAFLADNRMKVNINLAAFGVSANNNYVQVETPYNQWRPLFGNLQDQYLDTNDIPMFENHYVVERLNGNKKYIAASAAVMGPSIMLNFKDNSGFAFYNRTRVIAHATGINESLMKIYLEDLDNVAIDYDSNRHQRVYLNDALNQTNMGVGANAFQEFGFSYARVFQSKKNFIKAGVTLKYYVGLGAAYVSMKNLDYTLQDFDSITFNNADIEYAYTSEDFYQRQSPRLNDFFGSSKLGNGVGLDIGVVYEYRPDYKNFSYKMNRKKRENRMANKYKYRLAASIVDFGSIKYDRFANVRTINQTSETTGYSRFAQATAWDGSADLDTFMNSLFPEMVSDSSFRARLPAAIHLDADYHIKDEWYVSASYMQSLRPRATRGARVPRVLAVTPRYESRWLTVAAPISIGQFYHPLHIGLYGGFGFFHIGTDQLGSIFTGKKTNGLDIYAGVTLPIHHNSLKDSDGDGVDDLTDECPDEFGSYRTKGCPDYDGDKVADKDDLCPELPGTRQTKGCPDPDGDFLVLDEDQCPEEYGTKRNKGCPDSDDDGVHDGIDKCKDVYGEANMEGCPDTDKDGIHDGIDLCPETVGILELEGCPPVSVDSHTESDPPPTSFEEKEVTEGELEESKPLVIEENVITSGRGLDNDLTPAPVKPPESNPKPQTPISKSKPPVSEYQRKTPTEKVYADPDFDKFDFAVYDYYTILASYESLALAKALQKRLKNEAGLTTTIKNFPGTNYHYITTGKATDLGQAEMMKESLSTPIVLELINGRLWWKKFLKEQ
jgi:hypothetical protein